MRSQFAFLLVLSEGLLQCTGAVAFDSGPHASATIDALSRAGFTCNVANASCTGDISGGPWTAASPYTTEGSGRNGVKVKLFFWTSPAAP